MFKRILFALLTFVLTIQLAEGAVTPKDISKAINKEKLKHPYLYFNEEDKSSILERIKNDQDFGDIIKKLLADANRLMFTPVESSAPKPAPNPRFNVDWRYENYLIDNTEMAYKLAFAYQITGEEKYAYKAFEFAVVVCDQPTWVHGAHKFNIIYDRVWPWGAKDNQVAFGYSQWMDHIVFKIAAIYDWLYPALQKRQRDHIRSALLDKAILPVRGNYEYYWWATAYRCNWCSVCNASLGVAALSLLTEDPQLIDVIAESYNRISKNLDEIRSGGWQEGLSYLFYTIKTSLEFAEALKNVTNGKFNLYNHPRYQDAVKTFIYCQIPPDKSVHFGDSGGGKFGSYNIFNQLIVETGDPLAAWLRKYLTDDKPTDFVSLFKPKFPLKPEVPKISSIHFPAVDWIIMRSNFIDPEKVVVTAKCGMNDDPHHGHLDAGHFSLYWRGEEFICDHGSAGYDKKYFDKERWDYSLASSIGHNVVHVNGEKQSHCKYKDRPWRNDVGGKIIEFRTNNIRDYALMDPTNAYPKKELKSWRRHIILEKPFITVVLDEVKCAKDVEIEVRFHSPVSTFMPFHFTNYSFSKPENVVKQDVREGYVILEGERGKMALIPVVEGKYTVRPGKHAILMAQRNAEFRWVPYFGIVVNAESKKTVIGTIILPVKNDVEAKAIVKSIIRTVDPSESLTISLVKEGKTYSYRYNKNKDGLILAR